jgi:2-aminoadipate transaminase
MGFLTGRTVVKEMTSKLSEVGRNLQGSEIRRLFEVSMRPNVISFAGGMPDPDSFPAQEVAEAYFELLSERGEVLLQYGPSRGTAEGMQAAGYLMNRHGIRTSGDEILITSGGQQAINIVTQVLVDPGDVILMENPTFVGALGVFRNTRAKLVGIPMDSKGLIPARLQKAAQDCMQRGEKIKFLYIITNFQNPTGLSLAPERRPEILQIARQYDFLVLEDDPYGELFFHGTQDRVKPLKALDTDGRVIYAGSFSKIISPGIRLGWLASTPQLIERFDMARQMMDVCTNPLTQAMADRLCISGFLDGHIRNLRGIYAMRCEAMLAALKESMPRGVTWTKPEGGFYIWLTLPGSLSALDMLPKAIEQNVVYVIGNASSPDQSAGASMRISFCHENEKTIEEGIGRLARTIHSMTGKSK